MSSPNKRAYAKVYYSEAGEVVVAACDEDVLGLKLKEEERGVVLNVDPSFYGGELLAIDDVMRLVERAYTANLVGEAVVSAAIARGYVHPEAVMRVRGVPVALIVRITEGERVE